MMEPLPEKCPKEQTNYDDLEPTTLEGLHEAAGFQSLAARMCCGGGLEAFRVMRDARVQGIDLALSGFQWFAICSQRCPMAKFRHILEDQIINVKFL